MNAPAIIAKAKWKQALGLDITPEFNAIVTMWPGQWQSARDFARDLRTPKPSGGFGIRQVRRDARKPGFLYLAIKASDLAFITRGKDPLPKGLSVYEIVRL